LNLISTRPVELTFLIKTVGYSPLTSPISTSVALVSKARVKFFVIEVFSLEAVKERLSF
jgi:hypothetical protein